MKELLKKIKKEYKTNRYSFLAKVYVKIRRFIMFWNVKNENVRELAEREYVYKKLKRKFKKLLVRNEDYPQNEFSNKVWICWLQGYDQAPPLVKKCIDSVRKQMPDKEVIIIDSKNINQYITIPDFIMEKYKKGIIGFAHFSDIIRLELLISHGGLWIDSSVLVTGPIREFDKNIPLFVFKSVSLAQNQKMATSASNWLIYSCKNNNILTLTRNLIYEYWKKNNIAHSYLFFHIIFTLVTEVYDEEWKKVPTYSNIPPHILQFEIKNKYNKQRFEQIKRMSNFHKLNRRVTTNDIETNYYHIINDDIL